MKGVTKTIKNETKVQSMLLGTPGALLLGNLLRGKGIVRARSGNNKGKGIVRARSGNNKGKGIEELVLVINYKIKWYFNIASSFNKL